MGTIASQITSLTIIYATVYSDADERKPHKWSVTRKMFPFDDVIMNFNIKSFNVIHMQYQMGLDFKMKQKLLHDINCVMLLICMVAFRNPEKSYFASSAYSQSPSKCNIPRNKYLYHQINYKVCVYLAR